MIYSKFMVQQLLTSQVVCPGNKMILITSVASIAYHIRNKPSTPKPRSLPKGMLRDRFAHTEIEVSIDLQRSLEDDNSICGDDRRSSMHRIGNTNTP